MQFQVINLESVAAILGVIIASLGVIVAARTPRLQQRLEAAAKALAIVNNFVNYIKAIETNPELYESRDYYPDRIPETFASDNERHNERPFRLIFNATNKFKKEFEEAIIKVAEKESSSLKEIFYEIEQVGRELSNLLLEETKELKSLIFERKKDRQPWLKKIDEIHEKAKSVLSPIINGKDWYSTIFTILIILSLVSSIGIFFGMLPTP